MSELTPATEQPFNPDEFSQVGPAFPSWYLTRFYNLYTKLDDPKPIVLNVPTTADGQRLLVAESLSNNVHRKPEGEINFVELELTAEELLVGAALVIRRTDKEPLQVYDTRSPHEKLFHVPNHIGRLALVRSMRKRSPAWTTYASMNPAAEPYLGAPGITNPIKLKALLNVIGDNAKYKLRP
jgi:hypothetical protein